MERAFARSRSVRVASIDVDVPSLMDDALDDDRFVAGQVQDDVLPDRVAPNAGGDLVARSPESGKGGQPHQGHVQETRLVPTLPFAPPLAGVLQDFSQVRFRFAREADPTA